MEKILVSACLVGDNCKYDGKNNLNKDVLSLTEYFDLILICPETFGGLKTPRLPSERNGKKVINQKGKDVTQNYIDGAYLSLAIAKENHVRYAVMKEKSPSCGVHQIYDGSFSHKAIDGMGITSEILKANEIEVFSENEIPLLLEKIKRNGL